MYPHERSLVKKLADLPFALIGVNTDANLEEIRNTIKEKNLNWRNFWDGGDGPISKNWNIQAWPTVYVLDAQGKIRHNGPGSEWGVDETITKLLAEMGHQVDLSDDHDSDSGVAADDAQEKEKAIAESDNFLP